MNQSVAYDDALAALPTMTPTQLRQVQARTIFLLATTGGSAGIEEERRALYQTISDVLKSLHLKNSPPWAVFKKNRFYNHYNTSYDLLEDFMVENFEGMSTPERIQFYRLVLRILVRDLKRIGVEVSIGSITTNLGRVPSLIDRAFPGYIESGMMSKVLRTNGKVV